MWFFIFYRARCVYRVCVLLCSSNWTPCGDRQDGAKLLVRFTMSWPYHSSDSDYGCAYDVGCTPMGGAWSWTWTWRGVSSLIVVCNIIEDILKHITEMNFGGTLSCTVAFGMELFAPTTFKARPLKPVMKLPPFLVKRPTRFRSSTSETISHQFNTPPTHDG